MQAILMNTPGSADVLTLADIPAPEIQGEHDLRVRLHAAGVNPVDTKLRSRGTYFPDRLPTILGCDGAGVVEQAGRRVTRFKPGDEVYFCNGGIGAHPGTYAEYAIVDERIAAAKPRSLSFAEAAAAPLVLITAWEALYQRACLEAGHHVLIHGGAGGVGHVAIQLARLHGARVCTTASGADKLQFVHELGAERVIDYRSEDFVNAANAWSQGGVEVALDTVGGETFKRTVLAMRYAGDLVTLLQPGADMDWQEARLRNLRISLELMLTPMLRGLLHAQEYHAEILRRCAELFDAGKLRLHLNRSYPLAQAAEAHRRIEAGGMTGKIALTMQP